VNDETDIGIERDANLPYSKGLTAQTLMATGLPPELAWRIAAAAEERLSAQGRTAVTLADLDEIAGRMLGEREGATLMRRLAQWRRVRTMERPLIILIGGTTGVGKSTLANQLAHRLGIVRVASTDMVRQVMRAFFAQDLMPAIHYSSFDCAGAVRIPVLEGTDLARAGFIEQVKSVRVGIEALVAQSPRSRA
jgi:2-phosphoglycerate kinase